jgi:hypothetical protein
MRTRPHTVRFNEDILEAALKKSGLTIQKLIDKLFFNYVNTSEKLISVEAKENVQTKISENGLVIKPTIKRPDGLKGWSLQIWEKEQKKNGFNIIG